MSHREEQILESNGLTDAEKMRLLIWGDPKLGVRGVKGRLDRHEKLLWTMVVFQGIVSLALVGHVGLSADPNGGLIGALLKALFGG